jgi:hypothetical protein
VAQFFEFFDHHGRKALKQSGNSRSTEETQRHFFFGVEYTHGDLHQQYISNPSVMPKKTIYLIQPSQLTSIAEPNNFAAAPAPAPTPLAYTYSETFKN